MLLIQSDSIESTGKTLALADTPVESLKGVGPQTKTRLARLDILTVQGLLFHLPAKYQDRTQVVPIANCEEGQFAVVDGEILTVRVVRGRHRQSLLVSIFDGLSDMVLRFFHFSSKQRSLLQNSRRIRCFGEIKSLAEGLEMVHPEYQCYRDERPVAELYLTPVYPSTEGLHQSVLHRLMTQALILLEQHQRVLPDYLPAEWLIQSRLPSLHEALVMLHRPLPKHMADLANVHASAACQRLALEELLAHHLSLRKLREQSQSLSAFAVQWHAQYFEKFIESFGFQLTTAQQRVITEIAADLAMPKPMQRLLQGDVGSGKTIVAAVAALMAIVNSSQVVLLAPTELLAEQHAESFAQWFKGFSINVVCLSGKIKGKKRDQVLGQIASGEAQLIIGTHAVFQVGVTYHRLVLTIIDEQHRFGVAQRLALREKGQDGVYMPHQLTMTATPIPRTLAMTAYADLDVSVLDERPVGRESIDTVVIPEHRRDEVIARIELTCQRKRQVYWVCPLIAESAVLSCEAAEQTVVALSSVLHDCVIGLLHGRMDAQAKEQVMRQFKLGIVDILVATTVVEVGIDVPNATLMVIENAERLGLAQLHQLRGRVGRGDTKSYCVLMYHGRLSVMSKARLAMMRETNDGFLISKRDLALRGPGELLGIRQSGSITLRIADLARDEALFDMIADLGTQMLSDHNENISPLIERWLGKTTNYGNI